LVCQNPSVTDALAIHTSVPGPWGPFFIAATEHGIVAVDWLTSEEAFEARLIRRLGGAIAPVATAEPDDPRRAHLARAIAALEELLDGRPPRSAVAIDLSDRPAWDRDVLRVVAGIPFGSTASYGEIARRVGSPRAARAVGGAVGRNPIGLLIPCHRVIAADGTIGGYGGDAWGSREDRLEIKRALLQREGVEIRAAPEPSR
jgi:methylated-DNA-[protein]-cysteine S-methyltransferase